MRSNKYDEFDPIAEDIQQISNENIQDRMHVESEASDDIVGAYLKGLYGEEKGSDISEDLKSTDYTFEEIESVLNDSVEVEDDESSGMTRRRFMGWAGGGTACSYSVDSLFNWAYIESYRTHEEGIPSRVMNEDAVKSVIDGDDVDVSIYNLVTEENPSGNEKINREYVQQGLNELDPNFEVNVENLRLTDDEKQLEQIVTDYSIGDKVDEEDRLESNQNPGLISQVLSGIYDNYNIEPQAADDIPVVVGDFASGPGGISYFNSKWSLVRRENEYVMDHGTERIILHEIGHNNGLAHNVYPNRETVFPDVMSYSTGFSNIPYRISDAIDPRKFGSKSVKDWEKVKETVKNK
ncbi:MAG: hypothetical protein BRC29_03930 [Nanohaloarchaea archaeon SW_7_43_1]|nr:MAG: hypothetical protein BRC29_03930 [Nanohaloarchaea archaeon SW_7_43_1]